MFFKFFERFIYFFFDVQYDWEIGFVKQNISDYIFSAKKSKVKWLKMPRNVFWADPFVLFKNNKYYVYYEELDKNKGYGTINCMVFDQKMKVLSNDIVIDDGIHFSFPYLIEEGGEIYMLPETSKKNELALYKAIEFPLRWEKESVMLELPAMDSILFKEEGSWHLLYSDANRDDGSLFYRKSNDLNVSWGYQEEFFLRKDLNNTRAAGGIINFKGKRYRPTQKCDIYYGEAVVLNEIDFSNNQLKENEVKLIHYNNRFVRGFHTISSCENVTFVDRRRYRLFFNYFRNLFIIFFSRIIF